MQIWHLVFYSEFTCYVVKTYFTACFVPNLSKWVNVFMVGQLIFLDHQHQTDCLLHTESSTSNKNNNKVRRLSSTAGDTINIIPNFKRMRTFL